VYTKYNINQVGGAYMANNSQEWGALFEEWLLPVYGSPIVSCGSGTVLPADPNAASEPATEIFPGLIYTEPR